MIFIPNFLPPVSFFVAAMPHKTIVLSNSDIYLKQTFRNRATISGANKIENLIIPVHASSGKTPIREVKIDNHSAWQRTQLRTLQAAYRSAPFYPYYDYLFEPILMKQYDYLADIIEESIAVCIKALQLNKSIKWTPADPEKPIFATAAKAKSRDVQEFIMYKQVFAKQFVPNLSVVDLIFNMGPQSSAILINQAKLNTN